MDRDEMSDAERVRLAGLRGAVADHCERVLARRRRLARGGFALAAILAALWSLGCSATIGSGSSTASWVPRVGNWRGETEEPAAESRGVKCAEIDPPDGVLETLVCQRQEIEAVELLTGALCWPLARATARVRVARAACAVPLGE